MGARSRVRAYYESLREGEALYPYFAPDAGVVKFGISETLAGYEAVEDGLREQSRTTADWRVDSRALRVTERDRHAWFSDVVDLAWTDTERGIRFEFETRWSGTLERRHPDVDPDSDVDPDADVDPDSDVDREGADDWRFVGMHVSTAGDL